MFGFQITKWFWNLWDHLLTVILWNLLFLLVLGGFVSLFQFFPLQTAGLLTVLPIVLTLAFLYFATLLLHAFALNNYNIAKFERSDWKDCLRRACCVPSLLAALIFDILLLFTSIAFVISIRFYSQQGGFVGLLAMGLLFWLALLVLISIGFYFPMLVREDFSLKKAMRQSIVICLDNLLLTVGLGLIAIVLGILSFLPPIMLFFGPVGLGLWYEVSLRILFYKYQYLEQLPEEERIGENGKRKKVDIPWRVLLREEREKIGPRSLRNFIFPWKD